VAVFALLQVCNWANYEPQQKKREFDPNDDTEFMCNTLPSTEIFAQNKKLGTI
jgi:hypothetical protein